MAVDGHGVGRLEGPVVEPGDPVGWPGRSIVRVVNDERVLRSRVVLYGDSNVPDGSRRRLLDEQVRAYDRFCLQLVADEILRNYQLGVDTCEVTVEVGIRRGVVVWSEVARINRHVFCRPLRCRRHQQHGKQRKANRKDDSSSIYAIEIAHYSTSTHPLRLSELSPAVTRR